MVRLHKQTLADGVGGSNVKLYSVYTTDSNSASGVSVVIIGEGN